jgi:23S rRNA pseudouridine1911/1915/1917 synthase
VHFASVGHPVLGDRTYGRKVSVTLSGQEITFPRQMLHAASLSFRHPETGQTIHFGAPLPDDMREAVEALRGTTT